MDQRASWRSRSSVVAAGSWQLRRDPPSPHPPPTAAPRKTPAPRVDAAAVASRSHVPVLCYHQIRDPTSADSAADRQYIVSPSVLEAQLQALEEAGYTPVTGEAYVAHMARGAKLPRKPILLTFDDASGGQYTRALPILQEAPLRRDVLRDDGRARQGGLAHARVRSRRSTAPG